MEKLLKKLQKEANSVLASDSNKLVYIIGNNGTGKSRILQELANRPYKKDFLPKILCIANTIYDRFYGLNRDNLVYLGLRNINNAIFFSNISRSMIKQLTNKNTEIDKIESALGIKFYLDIDNSKLGDNVDKYVDKRRLKGIKSIEEYFTPYELHSVEKIISGVKAIRLDDLTSEQSFALNKFTDLNPRYLELKIRKGNLNLSFPELSSGEQNRILTAIKIMSNISNNCIVLIDEPEISLHLTWQMQYHDFINDIISDYKGVYVVIATHSPILVSESYKNKNTDSIVILEGRKDNFEYKCVASEDNSYDEIVLDFFNTATYKSTTIEEKIASLVSECDDKESIDDSVSQLQKLLENVDGIEGKKNLIHEAIKLVRIYEKTIEEQEPETEK